MKKIKKFFITILFTLMSMVVLQPSAWNLNGRYILPNWLDLSPISTIGVVEVFNVNEGDDQRLVWCIEPDVLAKDGAEYQIKDSSAIESAENIILDWYMNYSGNEWFGTAGGYYAVQVAIWGKMASKDPASLSIAKDADVDTATELRSLASRLYRSDYRYNPNPVIKINDVQYTAGTTIDLPEEYYLINGELYYQIAVETNRENGGGDINSVVTISGPSGYFVKKASGGDIVVSDSQFTLGNNNPNGVKAYIYIPAIKNSSEYNITVSESLEVLSTTAFDGSDSGSQTLQTLWTKTKKEELTFGFTWNQLTEVKENNISFSLEKVGQGVSNYSESEIKIPGKDGNPQSANLYTLSLGEVPLEDTQFIFALMDCDKNVRVKETKFLSEKNGIVNFKLSADQQNVCSNGALNYVKLNVSELSPTYGYTTKWVNYPSGSSYNEDEKSSMYFFLLREQTTNVFAPSTAKPEKIENVLKTFDINITKTDLNDTPIPGVKFGLYTTEDIEVPNKENIPAGSLVAIGTTDATGKLTFNNKTLGLVANQSYHLKEIETVDGYNLALHDAKIDGINAEIIDNGVLISFGEFMFNEEENKTINVTFRNDVSKIKHDLAIQKIDGQTNGLLANAEIKALNISTLDTFAGITDGGGNLTLHLDEGTYIVTETKAPEGYGLAKQQQVVLDSDKTITIKDYKFPTLDLTIQKNITGLDNTDAQFEIDIVEENSLPFEIEGVTGNSLTFAGLTNSNTEKKNITLKGLSKGSYSFNITEKDGGIAGWTYDSTPHTLTFDVVEDETDKFLYVDSNSVKVDGTLSNTPAFAFNNAFAPASIAVPIAKQWQDAKGNDIEYEIETEFEISNTNKEDKNSSFEFNNPINSNGKKPITFKFLSTGIYKYTISEKEHNKTYIEDDANVYTITFKIVKGDDGNLKVESHTIEDNEGNKCDEIKFVNKYIPTAGELTLTILKKVENEKERKGAYAEFAYTITDPSGNKVNSNDEKIGEEDASATVKISGSETVPEKIGERNTPINFAFKQAGEYIIKVWESDRDEMMLKDSTTYTIKVTTKNENNEIKIDKINDENPTNPYEIEFNNTYKVLPTVGVKFTKTTESTGFSDTSFTICKPSELNGECEGIKTLELKSGNQYAESELITLNLQEGDNVFTFWESGSKRNESTVQGWTYDQREYTLKVEVSRIEDFKDPKNWKYSISSVVLNDGSVDKEILQDSWNNIAINFKNSYQPDPVSKKYTINKTWEGTTQPEKFDSIIKICEYKNGAEGSCDDITINGNGNKNEPSTHNFVFTSPGTYSYKVYESEAKLKEEQEANGQIEKDERYAELTFIVEDKGGYLDASTTKTESNSEKPLVLGDKINFVNTYVPNPVYGTISVEKAWKGIYANNTDVIFGKGEVDSFKSEFSVIPDENNETNWKITNLADNPFEINGNGSQDVNFEFSKAGTYVFEIKETEQQGIAVDKNPHSVVFQVGLDLNGNLTMSSYSIDGVPNPDSNKIVFTNRIKYNSYKLPLTIKKTVINEDCLANEIFNEAKAEDVEAKFKVSVIDKNGKTIFDNEDNPYSIIDNNSDSLLNNETISIDNIILNEEGTYTIKVTEIEANNGMLLDKNEYEVRLTLVRNGFDLVPNEDNIKIYKNGIFTGKTIKNGKVEIEFTNEYKTYDVYLQKVITGRNNSDNPFTILINGEKYEMPELNGKNSVDKTVTLVLKEGLNEFTFKEDTSSKQEGWDYDGAIYKAEITVSYNQETREYEVSEPKWEKDSKKMDEPTSKQPLKWTNMYEPLKFEFNIQKTWTGLTGEDLKKVSPTFEVKDSKDFDKYYTVDENGKASVTYLVPNPGNYEISVTETEVKVPAENKGTVTKDETIYKINLKVVFGSDGKMKIESSAITKGDKKEQFPSGSTLIVNNEYLWNKIQDVVAISKEVVNKPDATNEFTFIVAKKDEKGEYKAVKELTIRGNGSTNFILDNLDFGTHEFKITEKNTNESGIEYDKSEYYVTYEVTEDEKLNKVGKITSITKNGSTNKAEVVKFVNTYKTSTPKPNKPTSSTPVTNSTPVVNTHVN